MPPSSISTRRRLEYAKGYIELGMIKDASKELDAINGEARTTVEVLRVRIDLCMETKQWEEVVALAKPVCEATPADEGAWIAWAYALRELQRVKEAQQVLLRAELLHGPTCAVLHYNLACYACLLGQTQEARQRLSQACKLDKNSKASALEDDDLRALWDDIAAGF
jgi:tetratricopeptide (TPR) repeat protein